MPASSRLSSASWTSRPARICSSPFKAKFKKRGKHTVVVGAVDTVGNVDPTPATYTWKIKKKKRKKRGGNQWSPH